MFKYTTTHMTCVLLYIWIYIHEYTYIINKYIVCMNIHTWPGYDVLIYLCVCMCVCVCVYIWIYIHDQGTMYLFTKDVGI